MPGAAGQPVRILWPASPVPNHGIAGSTGAGQQKIGRASGPLRFVGHDLAHAGRHRLGVDNILDRVAPVCSNTRFEGACGAEGALTGL